MTDSILFKKIYTDTLFKLLYKFFKEMISFIVFLIWQVRFSLNSYGYVFNTPLILFKIIKKGGFYSLPRRKAVINDRLPRVRKPLFSEVIKKIKVFEKKRKDDIRKKIHQKAEYQYPFHA